MEIAVDIHDVYVTKLEKWDGTTKRPTDRLGLESDHLPGPAREVWRAGTSWLNDQQIFFGVSKPKNHWEFRQVRAADQKEEAISELKHSWGLAWWYRHDLDMTRPWKRPTKWKKWRKIPWSQVVHTISCDVSLFAWIVRCKKIEKKSHSETNRTVKMMNSWRWHISIVSVFYNTTLCCHKMSPYPLRTTTLLWKVMELVTWSIHSNAQFKLQNQ